MRRFSILLATIAFGATVAVTYAQTAPTIVMPSQIKWSTQGVPKGMALATVGGDPNGTGWYVQRLKMAAGAMFPPHTHGKTETVTVLSGTLMVGLGKTVDKNKMTALPAGSFAVMPPNVPHYAMAKDDTVIQISGMGPSTTKMLSGGNMSM